MGYRRRPWPPLNPSALMLAGFTKLRSLYSFVDRHRPTTLHQLTRLLHARALVKLEARVQGTVLGQLLPTRAHTQVGHPPGKLEAKLEAKLQVAETSSLWAA